MKQQAARRGSASERARLISAAPRAPDFVAVYKALRGRYGYQGWWPLISMAGRRGYDGEGYLCAPRFRRVLLPRERMEIVAGALLTQNTSWENAKRAVAALMQRGLTDPNRLRRSTPETLAPVIRSSGSYNQKARKLMEAAAFLTGGGFIAGGAAPPRERLLGVWGIGEETADSILLYAFRQPRMVIDAYARRLFDRLGTTPPAIQYAKLQDMLESALPADAELLGEYHALIVEHAKVSCRKRPLCADCCLRNRCAFAGAHSPES